MQTDIRLLFLIALVYGKVASLEDYKTIQTDLGLIRGRLESTVFENKPFYAFRGIPYAKPPIDSLRFKVIVFARQKMYKDKWFHLMNYSTSGSTTLRSLGRN